MLPYSKRLVVIAAAPSLLLLLTLTVFGVIPVFVGVATSTVIVLSCRWLARRTERQSQFTLISSESTIAGIGQSILDALVEPMVILSSDRIVLLNNAAAQGVLGAMHNNGLDVFARTITGYVLGHRQRN